MNIVITFSHTCLQNKKYWVTISLKMSVSKSYHLKVKMNHECHLRFGNKIVYIYILNLTQIEFPFTCDMVHQVINFHISHKNVQQSVEPTCDIMTFNRFSFYLPITSKTKQFKGNNMFRLTWQLLHLKKKLIELVIDNFKKM